MRPRGRLQIVYCSNYITSVESHADTGFRGTSGAGVRALSEQWEPHRATAHATFNCGSAGATPRKHGLESTSLRRQNCVNRSHVLLLTHTQLITCVLRAAVSAEKRPPSPRPSAGLYSLPHAGQALDSGRNAAYCLRLELALLSMDITRKHQNSHNPIQNSPIPIQP